jgi:hypothetical protein
VEAIFRGTKDEEYRSRPTQIRERVYLYASLKLAEREYADDLGIPWPEACELSRGGILGSIDITDCRWDEERDCFVWKLERPRRYRELLRATGQPTPAFWRPKWRRRS